MWRVWVRRGGCIGSWWGNRRGRDHWEDLGMLQWYGHVQRMEEGRLPKEVMKWSPPGRSKQGRPKLTLVEGIRGLMGEKRLMEEDWNDRGTWRKKKI